MSAQPILRWNGSTLQPSAPHQRADGTILAADSWLVTEGTTLALALHEQRFLEAAGQHTQSDTFSPDHLEAFWTAAIAALPRTGDWFPRVELQILDGVSQLILRIRRAPERSRSVRVATYPGDDPRKTPLTKGPDLEALARVRDETADRGAEEAVILSAEGFVAEGAYSALLWWRGDVLCVPSLELDRIDSVTARSVIALATAFGAEIHYESVRPAALDGCEIWALSALHGIRIVTCWVDGPKPAELPGRLEIWRRRLTKLVQPLPIAGS